MKVAHCHKQCAEDPQQDAFTLAHDEKPMKAMAKESRNVEQIVAKFSYLIAMSRPA